MSCSKEGLQFDETEEEKKTKEEVKASFEPLCRLVKDILGDKVCLLLRKPGLVFVFRVSLGFS